MAANAEAVLKAYLISIGFKVDAAEYKKFKDQIQDTDKRFTELRETAIGMGIALGAAVKSMASDLDRLYFASLKTGSSASAITAWGMASKAAGISAESATAAAEGLALAVKQNPGLGIVLKGMLGVNTSQGSVEMLEQTVQRLGALMKGGPIQQAMGFRIGSMLGISPDALNSWLLNMKDVLAQKEKLDAWRQSMGYTSDKMQDTAKSAHEFQMELGLTGQKFDDLKTIIEGHLLPLATPLFHFIDRMIDLALKADKATGGWSSAVLALVGSYGTLAASKAALGFIGRGLGLKGGAAAAGVGGGLLTTAGLLGVAGGAAVLATNQGAAEWWNRKVGDLGVSALSSMGVNVGGAGDWLNRWTGSWLDPTTRPGAGAASSRGGFMDLLSAMARQEGFGQAGALGTRNKNPGNIQPGGVEESFATIADGYTAMRNLLAKSYAGLTLAQAITKWAPPRDKNGNIINDTAAYIANVSKWTGIGRDTVLTPGMLQNLKIPGADQGAGSSAQTVHNETHVTVHGAADPHATGAAVGASVDHANATLLRNLRGAFAG